MRTSYHYICADLSHIERIGKKSAYCVNYEEKSFLTAESSDHISVIEHAGGSLVEVYKEACKALSSVVIKHILGKLLSMLKHDSGMGDLMYLTDLNEAGTEASTVYDQELVLLTEHIDY